MRPLAIACYEDKIIQLALKKILEAIYEPRFLDCMYGFRPGRRCHDAIKVVYNKLNTDRMLANTWELVDVIQSFTAEKQGFVPKIILVSPPEIGTGIRTSPFYGAFFEEAIAESKRFPEYYKAVADAKGCIFFNVAEHIYPSEVDSLHLTPEGHKVLAEKLSEIVKGISG